MATTSRYILVLLCAHSALTASVGVAEDSSPEYNVEVREQRAPGYSGVSVGGTYGGAGAYAGGGTGFGPFGAVFPSFHRIQFPVPMPVPFAVPMQPVFGPFPNNNYNPGQAGNEIVNELFNAYNNAFQNFAATLQNRFQTIEPSNDPVISARQQTTLASLAEDARRAMLRAMCRALQRLQLSWADSSSVCSGVSGQAFTISTGASSSQPGGTQVSVVAPPGATVQHFEGPGGLQGVSVSHQSFGPGGSSVGTGSSSSFSSGTGSGNGGSYGGVFSSVSSGSSNINGQTDSFHSSTTGVNNNGHVSTVTVTKP